MKKNRLFWFGLISTAVFWLAGCGPTPTPKPDVYEPSSQYTLLDEVSLFPTPNVPTATSPPTPLPTKIPATPQPKPTVSVQELQKIYPEEPLPGSDVEVIASDLAEPVTLVFAPDGRLFFTEKVTGNIRVIVNGELLPEPVLGLEVGSHSEQGLLGLAVDPDFESNHYMWATYTVPARANNDQKVNRMIRFTEENNKAVDVVTVLETPNNEGDGIHNMNNLSFGPDGMLYVTVGEDNIPSNAQNLSEPRGKILRFKPTVPLSAPEDNPFYDGDGPNFDGIYAYGFRNSFDFVIDPLSDDMTIFATENGPSCDDEVNLVLRGNNYGWNSQHDCDNENGYHPELNSIPPMWYTNQTISPTGITVYTGDDFYEWGCLFLFIQRWHVPSSHA